MYIWNDKYDEDVIKWQYTNDDDIHNANLEDLIKAYEDMQEINDIEKLLHTLTNLEWIKTLTPEEFTTWYYDFWDKEQYKYNSSRDALEWWLQQMHDSNGEADQYIKSISKDTGINFNEVINEQSNSSN